MPSSPKPHTTALITGASAGIGLELARVFAGHGHDLVLVARSQNRLDTAADDLRTEHGIQVTVIPADLTKPHTPLTLFETLQAQSINVDILVNNAGVNFHGHFKDITLEHHLQLLQLNVIALTQLTHHFLPPMVESGYGRILNVASISAFQPVPTLSVYAATKAYVLSLTEALAVELRDTGVSATALCPGFTATTMLDIESATSGHGTPIPDFLISDPVAVAREGYEACMRGEPVHVSGLVNKAITTWAKHQPRWFGRSVGSFMTWWSR
ncbi:MAG: SDR family oxidoreductase [Candidatus Competibacteraceae bacterium]|jgi:short-subunit dehydrogenase|nr:SDR family oxidoreductase [Candidatus Competibacteraceae bacterium]